MNKLKYIFGITLISLSVLSPAQENLNDYLMEAAENNPAIKARFEEYMAALEVAPQVASLPDPQLAFGYFIQPVETRMGPQRFKISLTQLFPWFGTLEARENVAVQAAKAKYEGFEEAKAKLFNEVRQTYYNLYFTAKAISITSDNLELLQSFQQMALIKVKAGLASAVDQYRIEMEQGELENQLALLKDKLYSQTVLFKQLINGSSDVSIQVPDSLWETGLELTKSEILDSIRQQNHQLLKLDLEKEMLTLKKEVASLRGKPGFSVGIDYINIGKGKNNLAGKDALVFPKIGLTIPLYRNKYNAMVKEVVLQESAKQYEKEDKNNMLEALFENYYKDYLDGGRRIELFRSQLALARQSLKILETEYASNAKNFEELLRMERKLLQYALELEKAKADKQAAISNINYLMGK